MRKRYYKTLGTIAINFPMSPPSLHFLIFRYKREKGISTKSYPLKISRTVYCIFVYNTIVTPALESRGSELKNSLKPQKIQI